MRGSLAGLPTKGGNTDPAIAAASALTTTTSAVGPVTTTVTLDETTALDGWALANNVFTCFVPGVYRMDMEARLSITTNNGNFGYRVNGGALQTLLDVANTAAQMFSFTKLFKFAAGDTFEVRVSAPGSATLTVARAVISFVQVSTFQ